MCGKQEETPRPAPQLVQGLWAWGRAAGGRPVPQALGVSQPPSPSLQKGPPVTPTQCSPAHQSSTSLFLTDTKICSDKLSATAEI